MKQVTDTRLAELTEQGKHKLQSVEIYHFDSRKAGMFECVKCKGFFEFASCSNCESDALSHNPEFSDGLYCRNCEATYSTWRCDLCGANNKFASSYLLVRKGLCFIATAVYGSPSSPEVITFRKYRDEILLRSKCGSALVDCYYFISPTLAKLISKSHALQCITRWLLLEPLSLLLRKER